MSDLTGTRTALVSILSPVFNESAHISEMLESLLAQTHQSFEMICVDDGSTDNTSEIVREFAARDPRIRLIDEGKLGKVIAFNRAFEESRGDVIVLLGGDDVLPTYSLEVRVKAVLSEWKRSESKVAAFGHLRTFSTDLRYDGQLIPRSPQRGSRSGGALAISRPLAAALFPVPESLVSEDLWLGGGAESAADATVDVPEVVLDYRIHPGNSNPRQKPFHELHESMNRRMQAYPALARQGRFAIPAAQRQHFELLGQLEELRYEGRILRILFYRQAPIADRLRAASMANRYIYSVRRRLFKLFSGR